MAISNWSDLVESAEEVSSTEFTPLPNGEYTFLVTKSEVRQSQTGKTGYNIEAEVVEGDHAGRKVFNTFYISPESPKALGVFFNQMAAFGLTKEDYFSAGPTDEQVVDDLLGTYFVGTTEQVENNGKTYANFKRFAPFEGDVPEQTGPPSPAAPKKAAPKASPAAPKKTTSRRLPSSPASSAV